MKNVTRLVLAATALALPVASFAAPVKATKEVHATKTQKKDGKTTSTTTDSTKEETKAN